MDPRELRNALGRFPTGVAVIVTRSPANEPVGFTANSVTPVASDPPRLLWSLSTRSRNRALFEASGCFAINVLRDTQIDVARQMSATVGNRFAGVAWREAGADRLPLIDGSIAWFGCKLHASIEAGDHVAFLGDVIDTEESEGAPLLYLSGRYARLASAGRLLAAA